MNSDISKPGTSLTNEELIKELKKVNAEGASIQNVELKKLKSFHINKTLENNDIKKRLKKDLKNTYGIQISINNNKKEDWEKPIEIRQLIQTWLYLEKRSQSVKIELVIVWLDQNWIIDGYEITMMTKDEFLKLYNPIKDLSIPEEQLINQLTNEWIKLNDYTRRDLK